MMVSVRRFPRDLRHWLSTIGVAMPQAVHITAGQHEPRQEHSDNESDQPTMCHAYSLNDCAGFAGARGPTLRGDALLVEQERPLDGDCWIE